MSTTVPPPRGDFLSTLVDRAQGRAPVVAPRPASLFEPFAAAADFPVTAEAMDASSHDGSPGPASGRADEPSRATPVRAGPAPAPIVPATSPRETATLPPAKHREVTAMAPETPPPRSATARPVPAPAMATPAGDPPRSAADAGPVRPGPGTTGMARESRIDPVAAARADAPSPPHLASALPKRDVVATCAPQASSSTAPRESAAPAPAAPVVTISIGRVDVRAAPAAPVAARATPQAPAPMRLADYLDRKERAR